MWKICENHKIVEKFGAEISGLIGRENRCCNQLRNDCKNHGGKWCKMVEKKLFNGVIAAQSQQTLKFLVCPQK